MVREKSKSPAPVTAPELLTMDETIERLQTTRPTFYRWLRSGKITGTKAGGQWRFSEEDIGRFLHGVGPKIGLRTDITPLLEDLEDRLQESSFRIERDPNALVLTAFHLICATAEMMAASDIHLDRFRAGFDLPVRAHMRFRINGVLTRILDFDERLLDPLIEQVKLLSGLSPVEKNKAQSGMIPGYAVPGGVAEIDARVNVLPSGFGESLTLRIMRPGLMLQDINLDRLGLSAPQKELLGRHLHGDYGMILFSGVSGSGKSTTMYSALNELARPGISLVTVEDPIEVHLPWVVQTRVNRDIGFGFFEALQSVMRSDPDVVMVGEFPDARSVELGLKVAMTGHLVLATSHAPDAVSALSRLIAVTKDPVLVTEGVKLIVAQRLVRRLCEDCAEPVFPDKEEYPAAFALMRSEPAEKQHAVFQKAMGPKGCKKCMGTGYRGRMAIYEFLEMTKALKEAVRGGVDDALITELLAAQKFRSLGQTALDLVAEGKVYLGDLTF
jgi:excisionase family DNA binding protein